MWIKFFCLFIFAMTSGCAFFVKKDLSPSEKYFPKMSGCFLLYNMKTKTFDKVIGENVCSLQFPASSTFKVPLAVMAFNSGILKDENTLLKWNGVKDVREESNKDHDAKSWMKESVVWYSQRITPKLGKKNFQKYLDAFDYGNKDISAGITEAWLVSPAADSSALKISAYEQVKFMEKLWTDRLPASKRSMKLTRDITYIETSPKGFKLSGKTGSNFFDKEHTTHLGWFISHLSNDEQEYIVVTNLSDLKPTRVGDYGGPRAKAIAKQILADQGLW